MAQYLVEHHGFKKLQLDTEASQENAASNGTAPSPDDTASSPAKLPARSQPRTSQPAHTFDDVNALLDFVTKSWRSRWVITSIPSEAVLDALSRRPFFILFSVDAPLTVRWERHQSRSARPTSLEEFVTDSDENLYSPVNGAMTMMSRAAVR